MMDVNRVPKPFLDFDDAGASDEEPVKGIRMGDIRAWHDQYDNLLSSWDDCRERLREETNTVSQVWRALGISTFEEARGKTVWELVTELGKVLIVRCDHIARDVIEECREQGETDLRTVRSRISTALAKLLEIEK